MTDASVGRKGKRQRGAETVAAVVAAVADGATSWADVGRRVGVSRVRVSQIAAALAERGQPLKLERRGARQVKLCVRCYESAVDVMEKLAAQDGVKLAELHRRLLSEAIAARLADQVNDRPSG